MEMVGVIAASTELVKIAWSCYQLVKKLQHAPKRFEDYSAQLHSIIGIAQNIQENPHLHTDEVGKSLNPILETIAALESRLKKYELEDSTTSWRRLKNRVGFVANDDGLIELFDSLEKQKSALILVFSKESASRLGCMPELFGMVERMHDRALGQTDAPSLTQTQPIYMVPSWYCRNFIGRDDLTCSLERWVMQEIGGEPARPGTQIAVIRALGGQGKSQVALHLCQRLRTQDIFAILWVDATSEATLRDQFAALSQALNNDRGNHESEKNSVAVTINRLQHLRRPWLMVLDNYDDCQNFLNIKDYIPDSPYGSVVVTSRHGQSSELVTDLNGKDVQLEGLEKLDAIELLLKSSSIEISEQNSAAAERVASTLAYHPLALTQAAAFIKRRKMQMPQFESYYEKQKLDILNSQPSMALSQYHKFLDGNERRSTLNVFTTWELSFKQAQGLGRASGELQSQRSKALSALLNICAFTGSLGLSDILFRHYFDPQKDNMLRSPQIIKSLWYFFEYNLQTKTTSLNTHRFRESVADLADLSLIQSFVSGADDSTTRITLHPLVRDWLRLRIAPDQQVNYTWYVTSLVGSSLNEYFDESFLGFRVPFEQRGEMLQHIRAVADNYLTFRAAVPSLYQEDDEEFCDAVEHISLDLSPETSQAPHLGAVAATTDESEITNIHDAPSESLSSKEVFDLDELRHLSLNGDETMGDHAISCLLGCIQFCMTMYQPELAQDIVERTLPDWNSCATAMPNNLWLCRFLLTLVQVHYMREETESAEMLSAQFAQVYDTHSSSDAVKCLPLFWHALTLETNAKYESALVAFRRAEGALARTRGMLDHMPLLCRGNAALCMSRLGRHDAALELFTSTIADMRNALPPDCPMTMDVEFKASCAFLATGRLDEAIAMRRDIVTRLENAFGEEHVETMRSINYLANVLRIAGRTEEADALKARVAKLRARDDIIVGKGIL